MTAETMQHETPECMFCHQRSIVELTISEAAAFTAGLPIQDAMPDRPAPERELVRSGIHPACWAAKFG